MERLKNIAMFLAAPFVALAYIIALPIFGMYMLGVLAKEAYRNRDTSTGEKPAS